METMVSEYRIGEISERLGLSIDTLRYYEKIGLLPKVTRRPSGIRKYTDQDITRLKFIRRAQTMNFSLQEIAELLKLREDPWQARKGVQELTCHKLAEVESRLQELQALRDELRSLLKQCRETQEGCPIINEIDQKG